MISILEFASSKYSGASQIWPPLGLMKLVTLFWYGHFTGQKEKENNFLFLHKTYLTNISYTYMWKISKRKFFFKSL